MTPLEQAAVRNLTARVQLLERELRYMRQHRDKARTERDQARDAARYLHGLLLAYGYRERRRYKSAA